MAENKKIIHPYGQWPSPVRSSNLPGRAPIADVLWTPDGTGLIWLESHGGVGQLMVQLHGQAPRPLVMEQNVRGGVGYGGGEFGLSRSAVFFSEKGGGLYRCDLDHGQPRALTSLDRAVASPVVSPDGHWVIYVQSDGRQDVLAVVDSEGAAKSVHLVAGADFYMQPVWSPTGEFIAWVEWDHPNMPWEATRVKIGKLTGSPPRLQTVQLVAGGQGETVTQPQFSPNGQLLSYIVSNGDWQALEVLDLHTNQRSTWLAGNFDLSLPAWLQGRRSYGWSPFSKRIYGIKYAYGKAELYSVKAGVASQVISSETYTWLEQLSVSPVSDEVVLVASSPKIAPQVVGWDGSRWHTVSYGNTGQIAPENLPDPQLIEWPSLDGETVFGFFAMPASAAYAGEGLPPLIVHVHGGPTSSADLDFPREAQYFTSRGYAWLEVNHRGSTGYGRAYRDALLRNWGLLDVEDTVAGAKAMAARGLVDSARMVILGGSAGGFTVLNALARYPGVFRAGIAQYPVSNLLTLGLDTHKFEQHYDERLIGKLPEDTKILRDRSPFFHADKIKDAVAIFHGEADVAVPLNQSQTIVERLRANHVPHLFQVYPGEGHGFRQPETIEDMYARIEAFLLEHVLSVDHSL